MKRKVLVTGGAGFIGSHLVEKLHQAGFPVMVVDNLSHGDKDWLPAGVTLVEKDVRDPELSGVFRRYSPQIVYHLAAQQDAARATDDPKFDASVNIVGTINVLESCRTGKVRKLIYAGSVAGFGEPRKLPISADQVRQPQSFYGVSKHTVEHYLKIYCQNYGLEFVNLILANVYGPRQDPLSEGGVVAIFTHRMVNDQPVIIHGDGKQTRDFVYVDDVVTAFIQAMKFGKNQSLMVGTGKETSINQLFNLLKKITGSSIKPIYSPSRPGDVRQSRFSIFKTKRKLHWQPRSCLTQGLKKTLTYWGKTDFFSGELNRHFSFVARVN